MTHYHFIGIGGTGLAPIARILLERGQQVSGSDMLLSPMAQEVQELGAEVRIGHQAGNVQGADVVIRSSAVPDDNVEVQAALQAGIPVLKRVDFLKDLTAGQKVIAVAGTHGKTTTTAMITWCLNELQADPSFVVGGMVKNLHKNAHAGKGEYFVIEADEYDGMFLGLRPHFLVVTNIEHDHPDCYPSPQEYYQAFLKLSALVEPQGEMIACSCHSGTQRLMRDVHDHITTLPYGKEVDDTYRVSNVHHNPGCGVAFDLDIQKENQDVVHYPNIQLDIPGDHNALNAAAALAVLNEACFPLEPAIQALRKFSGTGRRFDIQGVEQGITVIDDYAHHPTEIRSTLSAARCRYPDRTIWAVWQPHTYSRTLELMDEFIDAFEDCDHLIVTEIYASREKHQDFSSRSVVEKMQHPDARQIAELKDVSAYLCEHLHSGDVLLVLSAGDADQVSRDVLDYLKGGA
ncbi:MAG: UDP-N-acetylmuramate--alanine ligase [Chloroflexota bacterium]|nr:UDP-N-acetylmuramate--alanine ligase [Chloroflexota bacterium]